MHRYSAPTRNYLPASLDTSNGTYIGSPELALAIYDFNPHSQDVPSLLPLRAGRIVRVLSKQSNGWWEGEVDGQRGRFPCSYVDPAPDAFRQNQWYTSSETPSTFPSRKKPSSPAEVLDTLRFTQDYYTEAIPQLEAQISLESSHSTQDHVDDKFPLQKIVTDILEYGKIVISNLDTLMGSTNMSAGQFNDLKSAKEGHHDAVLRLARCVQYLRTPSDPEAFEKQNLLRGAKAVLEAATKSVAAILNVCLADYRKKRSSAFDVPQASPSNIPPTTHAAIDTSMERNYIPSYHLNREDNGETIKETVNVTPASLIRTSCPSRTLAEEIERLTCFLESLSKGSENSSHSWTLAEGIDHLSRFLESTRMGQ